MTNPRKVVPNLRARREAKGYSIPELSRIAGVNQSTLKRAEAGIAVNSDSYKWIEEALNG